MLLMLKSKQLTKTKESGGGANIFKSIFNYYSVANKLQQNFYDPVIQNEGQRESLTQPLSYKGLNYYPIASKGIRRAKFSRNNV